MNIWKTPSGVAVDAQKLRLVLPCTTHTGSTHMQKMLRNGLQPGLNGAGGIGALGRNGSTYNTPATTPWQFTCFGFLLALYQVVRGGVVTHVVSGPHGSAPSASRRHSLPGPLLMRAPPVSLGVRIALGIGSKATVGLSSRMKSFPTSCSRLQQGGGGSDATYVLRLGRAVPMAHAHSVRWVKQVPNTF